MSSVSRAIRLRCAGAIASSVRMLCRRSASLIRMTRTSRAIASSILRKLSACASSREAFGIEPPLRQDAGDRQRMRDVRLARLPELSAMRGLGEFERALDERDVRLRQIVDQMSGEF